MEFTVLKTKLRISPLFFAVLTAFLLIDKSSIASEALLFSFLHETGHFLAVLCTKTYPLSVEITAFGIHMSLPENLSTAKKCFVLMAGFSMNFILAAGFLFLGKETEGYINFLIGIFTAMPVASADGGAVLKTLLEEYLPQKGEMIFKIVSRSFLAAVSIPLVFLAVFIKNYFLFFALIYIVLCAIK